MLTNNNSQRCIILIDGSNFYYKLKSLSFHNLLSFDFRSFGRYISGDLDIVGYTYYIGAVKATNTGKSKKLYENQQKLLVYLKENGLQYSLGYLLKYKNNVYHEKGVDVNMAIDMIISVYENLCDQIILISSDTDLIPAIIKSQEKGKIVKYIGFRGQISYALSAICERKHFLLKEDLEQFFIFD